MFTYKNAAITATTRLPRRPGVAGRWAAAAALAVFAAHSGVGAALAHDAPTGWRYPLSCCSGIDCREVSSDAISTGSNGYIIKTTGEVVGYSDRRIRASQDGEYHWCSVGGKDTGSTICLFVPPQSF